MPMNNNWMKRAAALGAAIALTLSCAVLPANAANNAEDFETGALGSLPSGWAFRGTPTTTAEQISLSGEFSHSGSKSLKISDKNPTGGQRSPSAYKAFSGTDGITEYLVSVWCNVTEESEAGNFGIGISASGATFAVNPTGASFVSGNNYAMYWTPQGAAGAGWQRIAFLLRYNTAPSSLSAILPTRANPTGCAYVDDMEIVALTNTNALSALEKLLKESSPDEDLICEILRSDAIGLTDWNDANTDDYLSQLASAARNRTLTSDFVQGVITSVNATAAEDTTAQDGVLLDLTAELHSVAPDSGTVLSLLKESALGIASVEDDNASGYANALKASLPSIGTLSAAQVANTVAGVNAARSGKTDAQIIAAALSEVRNALSARDTLIAGDDDRIAVPAVENAGGASLVWDKILSDPQKRVKLQNNEIQIVSRPENVNANVIATLKISSGSAAPTLLPVHITIKPYSDTYYLLASAAAHLDIENYLNGQSPDNIRSNIAALPTSLSGASVSWTVLNDTDLSACASLDPAGGTVTRPGLGDHNLAVLLRGTFSKDDTSYVRDYPLVIASETIDAARAMTVKNAGFENGMTAWIKTIKTADAAVSAEHAFFGSQSLRLSGCTCQSAKVFGVQEGYTYQLSAAAFAENAGSNPTLTLTFWDNEGVQLGTPVSTGYYAASSASDVWKYLTVSAIAPAGAVNITAVLSSASDTGWFDAVSLYEKPMIDGNCVSAWSGTGIAVQNGTLTLAADACATSRMLSVEPYGLYFLGFTGEATATLRFYDSNHALLGSQSSSGALCAYAPGSTAYANISFSHGEATSVSDIHFVLSASAIGSAAAWSLNNASASGDTITVQTGGSATSPLIPVQEGKSYIFTADASGSGTLTVQICNQSGEEIDSELASGSGTLRVAIDEMPVASGDAETRFVRLILSGATTFDSIHTYAVSTSVSNASMENGSPNGFTFFPYGWSAFGSAAAYSAKLANQFTEGNKGLAVEGFGLGTGGIRSSFVQITAGKTYEVSVKARAASGTAALKAEYWDENFNLLSSSDAAVLSGDSWQTYPASAAAPDNAAYLTLCVTTESGLVYLDEATSALAVREINGNLQLFVDDYLIGSMSGVTRNVHQATLAKTNKTASRWCYGNAFYDEQEHCYKMWCIGSGMAIYYSTSADGITWSNEQKCSYTKDGTEYTKFAPPSVFKVDNGDGTYTYKMVGFNNYDGAGSQSFSTAKYYLLTSSDGIHWTYAKTIFERALDVITVAYDSVNDEYICMLKKPLVSYKGKRTHRMMVSKDLENWTTPVRMYSIATPQDDGDTFLRTDGYGAGLYPLGDSYIGFGWRMRIDEVSASGYVDTALLFSRDVTEDWQRPFAGTSMIPVEDDGTFCAYTASYPMNVDTDNDGIADETWLYYGSQNSNHGTPSNYSVSVAKWRLNGFVSLDTGESEGTMTTRPFLLNGSSICLNAAVEGNLKAELLDENGSVISGYALADCDGLTSSTDGVDITLSWNGSSDLSALYGQTVSVRFVSTKTNLYSMQVK